MGKLRFRQFAISFLMAAAVLCGIWIASVQPRAIHATLGMSWQPRWQWGQMEHADLSAPQVITHPIRNWAGTDTLSSHLHAAGQLLVKPVTGN